MIFLSQMEYSIQIWPPFGPILTLWRQKMLNFQILKYDKRSNLSGQKIYMISIPSLVCLIAIYCFETALKNLGKWRQTGHPFYIFLQIFYKSFRILLVSYSLFHFAPIFRRLTKTLPKSRLFLRNKEMHAQLKNENWHNSWSRSDFDLRFFLKVMFFAGVLIEKTKLHPFSEMQYCFQD